MVALDRLIECSAVHLGHTKIADDQVERLAIQGEPLFAEQAQCRRVTARSGPSSRELAGAGEMFSRLSY